MGKGKAMFRVLVRILLFLSLGQCEPSDMWQSYSTSVVAMENLFEVELFLTKTIQDFFESDRKDDIVRNFLDNVDEEHKKSNGNPELFLSNPLNGFALLRRMKIDWPIILDNLERPIKEYVKKAMNFNNIQLPTRKDIIEAVEGMERIRKTYKLCPMDIAKGRLNGIKYDARLSSSDLFTIGFELFKQENYINAASWLKAALHTDYQGWIPSEISGSDLETIKMLYLETISRQSNQSATASNFTASDTDENFERSCHEEESKLMKDLFCRYNTTVHPFYILAPLKMEELSKDPFVIVFHDVLTNAEIDYIKYEARPVFARAKVVLKSDEIAYDDVRTSHSASIYLKSATLQKISTMTGFNPDGFEDTSVLNYGIGGHYLSHEDYFYPMKDDWIEDYGDRIATILIYLNDVEQGGSTVFPKIGLTVKPKKNSILLWYNLKNSGDVDSNTTHGACPVIFGSKWAATIWVRERPQFRTMPCFNP